jgi:hypothetical protein
MSSIPTFTGRTGRSGLGHRLLPSILMPLAKLAKAGCIGVTCPVGSWTSTGELHEQISALHAGQAHMRR